ncbi:MAG: hypothetical protein PHQ96_02905 [Candidatus Omnitrophica bacterium]|nr:hypothetical protein [Candidatus Omnitrophota bacterium]
MYNNIRILVLFLIIALISCLFSFSSFAQYQETVGKEVILKAFEDSGFIYAGVDKKNFQAATSNLMAKNKENYLCNRLSNGVFEIPQGTKAVILDVDFWAHAAKVRISEGTFAGQTCWVIMQQALGY